MAAKTVSLSGPLTCTQFSPSLEMFLCNPVSTPVPKPIGESVNPFAPKPVSSSVNGSDLVCRMAPKAEEKLFSEMKSTPVMIGPPALPTPSPAKKKVETKAKPKAPSKPIVKMTQTERVKLAGYTTIEKVKELQRGFGLKETGVVDKATEAAFAKAVLELQVYLSKTHTVTDAKTKTVKTVKFDLGNFGPKVKGVHTGVDGLYGPKTHAAYQKALALGLLVNKGKFGQTP